MTKREYAQYESAFAAGMRRFGIHNLSSDGEGSFSWSPCLICRSHLGGDRYDCTGWNPTAREVVEVRACVDCVYYAEYGQLDDETMLSIEASAE